MVIGDRINLLRNYIGITQKELGGNEYAIGYVSKVENKQINPSLHFIDLVSKKLRVIGNGSLGFVRMGMK